MNKNDLIKLFTSPLILYVKYFPFEMGKHYINVTGKRILLNYNGELKTNSEDGRKFIFHFPQDHGVETVYFSGKYETGTTNILKKIISKDNILFDLGANYGWYTTLFARLAPKGYCHAFEPVPWIFKSLEINCQINSINNIFLNQMALGDSKKEIEMFTFDEFPHGHSSISNYASENYTTAKSQMITMNDYIHDMKIDKVDIVKCDIEGSELKMLEGAVDLFALDKPPIWLFEMNKDTSKSFGYLPHDILEFLMQFDKYVFFKIEGAWGPIKMMKDVYDYENGDNVLCIVPKYHKFQNLIII